jgi:hypothetical protein
MVDDVVLEVEVLADGGVAAHALPRPEASLKASAKEPLETLYFAPVICEIAKLPL